jgi:hypothetical protein
MYTTVKHHAAGTVKFTVPYKDFCIFFINWEMAIDIQLKDYILYKYKERIKEKGLSIISSGNRGCCSSTVPIREPPLIASINKEGQRKQFYT